MVWTVILRVETISGFDWVPRPCTEGFAHTILQTMPNRNGREVRASHFLQGSVGLDPAGPSELRSGRTRIFTLVCPSSKSVLDYLGQGLGLEGTINDVS